MPDVRLVIIAPDELRELIADAVRAVLQTTPCDEWVDARGSGLGRRQFLRLARESAFPVFKRGRSYVAKRADVDAYIERQRIEIHQVAQPEPASAASPGPDPIAAALAAGRLRVVKKSP